MEINRRDFLKASSAVAVALGLTASGLMKLQRVWAAEGGQPVVWLQGQGCTGCSTSLLNTIYYTTIDDLLLNTIDLEYHPTVMAAAGDLAVSAAEAARTKGGYVLVVEGAIPTAEGGRYCYLWPGMTALDAVKTFSQNAAFILAVGTCAAYGGIPGGKPNPTLAKGVSDIIGGDGVIDLPGCPTHPDWIVGTIAHLLTYGVPPRLDDRRPVDYYGGEDLHDSCPRYDDYKKDIYARELSQAGCLKKLGCQGKETHADCPTRKWNSPAQGEYGVNWCIGAGNPCQGCTEPGFPDSMSPFYTLEKALEEHDDKHDDKDKDDKDKDDKDKDDKDKDDKDKDDKDKDDKDKDDKDKDDKDKDDKDKDDKDKDDKDKDDDDEDDDEHDEHDDEHDDEHRKRRKRRNKHHEYADAGSIR